LRLALAHRYTVWISASVGTLTVAAVGSAVGWLFGHIIESPSAPSVAAVLGAILAAAPPAWAYSQVARRRANAERDSLIDPVSVPTSR
jgi:integral membrane sensor domain MASE1